MRIRTAIFVVYVVASALGFAVLMRFVLAEVRPRYITAVRNNLEDTARIMAAALRGRSVADAKTALAGPVNFHAQLLTQDGHELFDSREAESPEAGGYDSNSDIRLTRRVGDRLIDGDSDRTDTEVSIEVPVKLAGDQPARLVLSRSFRGMNAVIWTERKKLAGVGLLVAGVMVVAGWWIAARLTHSLERLTIYVQAVRDGRPGRPPQSRATEIAALAKAFEEMRDALEGRQHVERYTQALAHEVKAPLAAIRGAAELLGEDMPEEQREKFLGNIRSEAARIQQLVERLLELSSLEARKALRQTETLAAGRLAGEAVDLVRPAGAGRAVTLTIQVNGDATVRGEGVLLREALVNLLQNAVDFSPAGSDITLAINVEPGRVVFVVEDHGPGVPDFALPRAFERFYSLPRPGTERKSTGLGLALVREIAHLHGGEASLANRPEGGARALLWLPAV